MSHQVGRDAGDARLGADDLLQRRPAAFQPGLLAFLLVLRQLVHLLVHLRQRFFLQAQFGQARLEVDGHRGAVLLRLLHVVDVDVVTEHGAGVAVLARYRRAGEGDESGVGQGVAQVLSVADLVTGNGFSRQQRLVVVG